MKRLATFVAALCIAASALAFPFVPVATTNLVVTGSAQNLSLSATEAGGGVPTGGAILAIRQIVLTNVGTQTVFYTASGVTATVSNGMPLLANSQVVISLERSVTALSVIAGSTGSTLYATVGVGE